MAKLVHASCGVQTHTRVYPTATGGRNCCYYEQASPSWRLAQDAETRARTEFPQWLSSHGDDLPPRPEDFLRPYLQIDSSSTRERLNFIQLDAGAPVDSGT